MSALELLSGVIFGTMIGIMGAFAILQTLSWVIDKGVGLSWWIEEYVQRRRGREETQWWEPEPPVGEETKEKTE